MRLPEKKREELKEKGKRETPPPAGGGARGRLRQFEEERGMEDSDLGNPAVADEPSEKKKDKDSGHAL
jgi:hypothetical protein